MCPIMPGLLPEELTTREKKGFPSAGTLLTEQHTGAPQKVQHHIQLGSTPGCFSRLESLHIYDPT